jgi:hypothetical protein
MLSSVRIDRTRFTDDGHVQALKEIWLGKPRPDCDGQSHSDVSRVGISALWGLWVMLGAAVVVALLTAAIKYCMRRRQPELNDRMAEMFPSVRQSLRHWSTSVSPSPAMNLCM